MMRPPAGKTPLVSHYLIMVKAKAHESRWCVKPYKGFVVGSPSETFKDIVSTAFDDVNNSYSHAKHSRYDEMYHPHLGTFRERKMYTTLAPSLCIPKRNRVCDYDLVPHKSYNTKQSEWLVERDRNHRVMLPRIATRPLKEMTMPGEKPLSRCYTLPTSTTRFDNYFRYWKGRACGLDYISPFLEPEDWRPAEDRRYQRIYWAPEFLSITPSCRHAANFMLSAY
ncbi:unnamed protein product [Cylicocyclus nassatus]|uniref:Uncharacterized protein n=1 Tax=Cylicocyclus nassatus TaxID=53992 RepID=A0AA36DVD4_CYLNA|nr:unnamed protein product [Cylicocyclus nassatus]